jgi:hypothetical protein
VSPYTAVALCGAAILALGWLWVSFAPEGRGRAAAEWIATTAMYLALASWFAGLSLDAHAEGRTALLVPFGFLTVLFSAGLCVSVWRTLAFLLGRTAAGESTTN